MSFYTHRESVKFLDQCLRRGEIVIGIERFILVGDKLRADLNGIADFSSLETSEGSVAEAHLFLEKFGQNPEERFEFEVTPGED